MHSNLRARGALRRGPAQGSSSRSMRAPPCLCTRGKARLQQAQQQQRASWSQLLAPSSRCGPPLRGGPRRSHTIWPLRALAASHHTLLHAAPPPAAPTAPASSHRLQEPAGAAERAAALAGHCAGHCHRQRRGPGAKRGGVHAGAQRETTHHAVASQSEQGQGRAPAACGSGLLAARSLARRRSAALCQSAALPGAALCRERRLAVRHTLAPHVTLCPPARPPMCTSSPSWTSTTTSCGSASSSSRATSMTR
jgi:hypothetical protein